MSGMNGSPGSRPASDHRCPRRSVGTGTPHMRLAASRGVLPSRTTALAARNTAAARKRQPKKRTDGGVRPMSFP